MSGSSDQHDAGSLTLKDGGLNLNQSAPKRVPWSDWMEWMAVYNGLFPVDSSSSSGGGTGSSNINKSDNKGNRGNNDSASSAAASLNFFSPLLISQRAWCLEVITMWKSRGKLPIAIESTASLIEIIFSDTSALGFDSYSSYLVRGTSELRMSYAMAIVRSVNLLAETLQNGLYAESVLAIANKIGLPAWIVEIRHDATHNTLPTISLLRKAASYLLEWLYENYWQVQFDYLSSVQDLCCSTNSSSQNGRSRSHGNNASMNCKNAADADNKTNSILEAESPLSVSVTFANDIFISTFIQRFVVKPSFGVIPKTSLKSLFIREWLPVFSDLLQVYPHLLNIVVASLIVNISTGLSILEKQFTRLNLFISNRNSNSDSDSKNNKKNKNWNNSNSNSIDSNDNEYLHFQVASIEDLKRDLLHECIRSSTCIELLTRSKFSALFKRHVHYLLEIDQFSNIVSNYSKTSYGNRNSKSNSSSSNNNNSNSSNSNSNNSTFKEPELLAPALSVKNISVRNSLFVVHDIFKKTPIRCDFFGATEATTSAVVVAISGTSNSILFDNSDDIGGSNIDDARAESSFSKSSGATTNSSLDSEISLFKSTILKYYDDLFSKIESSAFAKKKNIGSNCGNNNSNNNSNNNDDNSSIVSTSKSMSISKPTSIISSSSKSSGGLIELNFDQFDREIFDDYAAAADVAFVETSAMTSGAAGAAGSDLDDVNVDENGRNVKRKFQSRKNDKADVVVDFSDNRNDINNSKANYRGDRDNNHNEHLKKSKNMCIRFVSPDSLTPIGGSSSSGLFLLELA